MTEKYDDLLHLPRPISSRHAPMSSAHRAAQFSPFAALTGYDAVIAETGRLTTPFSELDKSKKSDINLQLQQLKEAEPQAPHLTVIFFQPDPLKNGGSYLTHHGQLRKLDIESQQLCFLDGTIIPFHALYELSSPFFSDSATL